MQQTHLEAIYRYFPNLSVVQKEQITQLLPLYLEWNSKINVISRKDVDNLYLHHVLHALAIAKVVSFKAGAQVLDLGTGGGFPGIPLAILFPKTQFTLIDGTRKKLSVVEAVATEIGLQNVRVLHQRAEEHKSKYDFVVSRAVARLSKLLLWSHKFFKTKQQHALPNGLIALKGGNIQSEIKEMPRGTYAETYPLSDFFSEQYFEEKHAIYVQG